MAGLTSAGLRIRLPRLGLSGFVTAEAAFRAAEGERATLAVDEHGLATASGPGGSGPDAACASPAWTTPTARAGNCRVDSGRPLHFTNPLGAIDGELGSAEPTDACLGETSPPMRGRRGGGQRPYDRALAGAVRR